MRSGSLRLYSPDMGSAEPCGADGAAGAQGDVRSWDMEALEELEFNLLWHHALRLEMEEDAPCPEDAA